MTNLEIVVAVLAAHREARQWADATVARDLLDRFGIDAGAEFGPSDPMPVPEGTLGTHQDIETKYYSDGTSATGPGPLPDMSPVQQDARSA